jgi:hypothetical protein
LAALACLFLSVAPAPAQEPSGCSTAEQNLFVRDRMTD